MLPSKFLLDKRKCNEHIAVCNVHIAVCNVDFFSTLQFAMSTLQFAMLFFLTKEISISRLHFAIFFWSVAEKCCREHVSDSDYFFMLDYLIYGSCVVFWGCQ